MFLEISDNLCFTFFPKDTKVPRCFTSPHRISFRYFTRTNHTCVHALTQFTRCNQLVLLLRHVAYFSPPKFILCCPGVSFSGAVNPLGWYFYEENRCVVFYIRQPTSVPLNGADGKINLVPSPDFRLFPSSANSFFIHLKGFALQGSHFPFQRKSLIFFPAEMLNVLTTLEMLKNTQHVMGGTIEW